MAPDGNNSPRLSLHATLVQNGRGDLFDRHIFACVLTAAIAEQPKSPSIALGLSPSELGDLFHAYFPGALDQFSPSLGDGPGEDAIEEPDLRALLLDHRNHGAAEEAWLASIIARRSLRPNHLWQDLGLFNRGELNDLLRRHFPGLHARNNRDMKWKKFFYRELCQMDGIVVCKAPVCDVCPDFQHCFGSEEEPLARLQSEKPR